LVNRVAQKLDYLGSRTQRLDGKISGQ